VTRLRILLADDHPVVLAGVRALIAADPLLDIIAEAGDGRSALALATDLCPDVAVLDVSLPNLSGAEIARQLAVRRPACRILILTLHEDAAYVRQLLKEGVSGYLLKRSASTELCRAIHAVAAGGLYLDPAIAGHLMTPDGDPTLSDRESAVLRLSAGGHSNKAIAHELTIGVKTVETYKTRAMTKLGIHSRVEVIRFAQSKGWI
jgi:DNA-binding NarL/FixJ family response regulator